MDIFDDIKKRQKEFLENPRESIQNLIEQQKSFSKGLIDLSLKQNKPEMAIQYYQMYKEYGALILNLVKKGLVSAKSFKDDFRDGSIMQSNEGLRNIVIKRRDNLISTEEYVLFLKKSYSSLLENIWGKLKRIIFLSGLNPQGSHLNLRRIKENLEKLEIEYSISLNSIKNTLEGKLRNCINHENTAFRSPNFLIFMEEVNGKLQEFHRINSEELIEEIVKSLLTLSTLHHLEITVITSHLESLLKLDDKQLDKYSKTGILTPDMEKKILEK